VLSRVHPWFFLVPALAVFTGCVSPNVRVDRARTALRTGNDSAALVWSEDLKNSFYSKDLGYLESGRVRMLGGDFLGSSTNLSAAIDTVIEQTDEGPRVKLGDVGANVMAGTITDDRTRPYRLPPYEFIHALEYQMLNRVFLGDLGGAAVEARRAVFAQDQIAEKYGADVRAARDSVPQDQSAGLQKVDEEMARLDEVANLTRSSYENPLAWWLCGILFEQDRDIANARLAYQKAHDLAPGNPFAQRDWLRALRVEDRVAYRAALARANVAEAALARPETEIVLVFEQGFVPQRLSKKIPVPVLGTVVSVDFPFYEAPAYTPAPVALADGGRALGASALALNVQALAYRDLKEKIPGIVTRNVSRAAVRIAASVAAKEAARRDSSGVGDVVQLGVFLGTAVATAINRADTRAWYTLPMVSHVWRGAVEPGARVLALRSPLTGWVVNVPVTVARGEARLVWVADTGGNARVASAPLNGKGAPAAFGIYNSVMGSPSGH
jgi:hypothetical protein